MGIQSDPRDHRIEKLEMEVRRLRALLTEHGIELDELHTGEHDRGENRSADQKIQLFQRLFRGREDVHAVRWQSNAGRSGYAPACENEWKPGLCEKPRIKCADCGNRSFVPLDRDAVRRHLTGRQVVGVYPLLEDDSCWFLAIDFDKAGWREDVAAVRVCCEAMEVPCAVEISRSGNGAHLWVFFSEPVPATIARALGFALISRTCASTRQLSLESYDRLFPNQDVLPKGGFGNLIALPLQREPRREGRSVFVDEAFEPYPDQWRYLESLARLSLEDVESAVQRASDGGHPLDVPFTEAERDRPWETNRPARALELSHGELPPKLTIVLANQLFIEKDDLPQPLSNRIIRLAAFPNPEFHKAQAMRMPVWNKPRLIGCAESFPRHIALPRGCWEQVQQLLDDHGIEIETEDRRTRGANLSATFLGELREDQDAALKDMLPHDTGVLSAPTGFGKTVLGAALIAKRQISTLVLVHRRALQDQWANQLVTFLDLNRPPGVIGGGKDTSTGLLDVAVIQSLTQRDDLEELLDRYGQIIVDECHHVSATSFERVLKAAKARYVVGLSATPIRRDGHDPIIFMQCGPIRHREDASIDGVSKLEVRLANLPMPDLPAAAPVHAVYRALADCEVRNRRIATDVINAYNAGRKVLVLTERTDHVLTLYERICESAPNCWYLHGRLGKKRRKQTLATLENLQADDPRVLVATGKLVGEGFDHPPLDTLALALPISWKGTLAQYAGRLHRSHGAKEDVRIYDYVETDHPMLSRMGQRRQAGYRAMGYTILEPGRPEPTRNLELGF